MREHVIIKYTGPNYTALRFWDGTAWVSEYPDAARYYGHPGANVMRAATGWSAVVRDYGSGLDECVVRVGDDI